MQEILQRKATNQRIGNQPIPKKGQGIYGTNHLPKAEELKDNFIYGLETRSSR